MKKNIKIRKDRKNEYKTDETNVKARIEKVQREKKTEKTYINNGKRKIGYNNVRKKGKTDRTKKIIE